MKRVERVLGLALFLFSVLGFSQAAKGLPQYGGEVEYYSDGTYTTQVGYWFYSCQGQFPTTTWGVTSAYPQVLDIFVCSTGQPCEYEGGITCYDEIYIRCNPWCY